MGKFECTICNNTFNGKNRRPRSLPCGHGFCTSCIESCIKRGAKACPICRVPHGANSAKALPVNFLLEEFLHKTTISSSRKHKSDLIFRNGVTGMCPKHKGIPLYFHCKSHKVEVCHSCAVIDHPPKYCNLISLDDKFKEKKKSQILAIQKQKNLLINVKKGLNEVGVRNISYINRKTDKKQDLENQMKLIASEIRQIHQKIVVKRKFRKEISDTIKGCQNKLATFDVMENNLRAAISNQDIANRCSMSQKYIFQNLKWEDSMRRYLHMSKKEEKSETRGRKKMLVDKIYMDEDGCLTTKKEYEYVDSEKESNAKETPAKESPKKLEEPRNKVEPSSVLTYMETLTRLQNLDQKLREALGINNPHIEDAKQCLEEMSKLTITGLMLKNHIHVVNAIYKCRRYKYDEEVCNMCNILYNKFKELLEVEDMYEIDWTNTPNQQTEDVEGLEEINTPNILRWGQQSEDVEKLEGINAPGHSRWPQHSYHDDSDDELFARLT